MYLTRHQTTDGARWAVDGEYLPSAFSLELLLQLLHVEIPHLLHALPRFGAAEGVLLPPIEAGHEVWAAGVTYVRSREAREAESTVKDVYTRVYEAERPELFFKALGRRVVGHGMPIRIREDSGWNVPEPELTLVVNAHREIVGCCAGNDVSSRDIEGANPLYLPQAKVYEGACALGPGIRLGDVATVAVVDPYGVRNQALRAIGVAKLPGFGASGIRQRRQGPPGSTFMVTPESARTPP